MATKRSTKTLGDLIAFADRKMLADLEVLRPTAGQPDLYFYKVTGLAYSLKEECITRFPGWYHSLDKLLPQSLSEPTMFVSGCIISQNNGRPYFAIWASVYEYLEANRKELGL